MTLLVKSYYHNFSSVDSGRPDLVSIRQEKKFYLWNHSLFCHGDRLHTSAAICFFFFSFAFICVLTWQIFVQRRRRSVLDSTSRFQRFIRSSYLYSHMVMDYTRNFKFWSCSSACSASGFLGVTLRLTYPSSEHRLQVHAFGTLIDSLNIFGPEFVPHTNFTSTSLNSRGWQQAHCGPLGMCFLPLIFTLSLVRQKPKQKGNGTLLLRQPALTGITSCLRHLTTQSTMPAFDVVGNVSTDTQVSVNK